MAARIPHKPKSFRLGGVHPNDMKLTAHVSIEPLPLPAFVTIPVIQHIGAPAKINVQVGDSVQVGQIIATHEGFVSSNIHASASGTVTGIHNAMDSSGFKHTAIDIQRDGDKWIESIESPDKIF